MSRLARNTAERIEKKLPQFRAWLSGCGAQVMEPTNEWELARFKSGDITSVIYRNKVGGVRFVGEAERAYHAFSHALSWRTEPASVNRKRMTPMVRSVRARDGDLCFYCQREVSRDNQSIEHLVSVAHRGPNHISNLFLAHKSCNAKAGHLSAPEKIKIHVEAVLMKEREAQIAVPVAHP